MVAAPLDANENSDSRSVEFIGPASNPEVSLLMVTISGVVDVSGPNKGNQQETPVSRSYTAVVVHDWSTKREVGSLVKVKGPLNRSGSNPSNVPKVPVGATILIAVTKSAATGEYDYAGESVLPIGLKVPAIIKEGEGPAVSAAIEKVNDAIQNHGGRIPLTVAHDFLKSHDYFSWALGVQLIATKGTASDANLLIDLYRSRALSLRSALWIDEMLERLPEDVRPTTSQRHQLLVQFLRYREGEMKGEDN